MVFHAFRLPHNERRLPAGFFSRAGFKFDDARAFEKRGHRQAAGEARRAIGGQNMRRPRDVVSQGRRSGRAQENSARVPDPICKVAMLMGRALPDTRGGR